MKQKIRNLLHQLNHGLVEREDTLKTALLTVLAHENLVLIGPPGTGKSLMARRVADGFAHGTEGDGGYFEYLLTKFSTPEEIFGPLSISELKADRFRRNTSGYLPTVKLAFLDEIFKASSSILNALLTILNERIYHNGAEPQKVPLQSMIAASNELPTNHEELNALYDRFLVRRFVDYVSQENLHRLFEKSEAMPALDKLTVTDLECIKRNTESVTIPPEIVGAMQRIWTQHKETFREDRRESLSDRRLKKVIKLLCVSAATNGRREVDLSDVFLLKDCLWNHQENAAKVRDLILNVLRGCSRPVPQNEVASNQPAILPKASRESGSVAKGYKGSGSAQDPLLIQTVEDLMDLGRADVGQKGYYFRQTADVDCTALSSWADISFCGHYDGGGYSIKATGASDDIWKSVDIWNRHKNVVALFRVIQQGSSITNLKLEGLSLAADVNDTRITQCASTTYMIKEDAANCIITACQTDDCLIGSKATDCSITACKAGETLIAKSATNSSISDCLVVIREVQKPTERAYSGIAATLTQSSVVERCFVTGSIEGVARKPLFCGIAHTCKDSTIRQSALGKLTWQKSAISRIAKSISGSSTLENNASIDDNIGVDDINGKDGRTIAKALFKQRFFEHTLGWDFANVWQWDDANDMPVLRLIDLGIRAQQAKSLAQDANTTDLLALQMQANIWV